MITRDEFPYLQELIINDAYAAKNLSILIFEKILSFKHLILTGKNGSGKTTVLIELSKYIQASAGYGRIDSDGHYFWNSNTNDTELLRKVIPIFSLTHNDIISRNIISTSELNWWKKIKEETIFAFFEARRNIKTLDVSTITRDYDLVIQVPSWSEKSAAELFKQYIVNKKVFQVFDIMEGRDKAAKQQEQFFNSFEKTLGNVFKDPDTKLEFVRESFEFYINLSDGRRFTFNQLSAGFSAFLSIFTELLMRTDILRKQANDYTYNPCGFVLIDEPETHLHLEMQYQILPLLTEIFPNLQFIVATHSPAVASSIKNATVFDLSTGEAMGDEAAGSSFSELMQTHFGVENEYSNVADEILADIKHITKLPDHEQARQQLLNLLAEKGRYMSAGLRLEVEAQLIGLE